MYASKSPLLAVAAVIALGILSAPVLAAETAADVPKDSYYNDPLTATERSGIAQEENVSPNDGRASVPNATIACATMRIPMGDRDGAPASVDSLLKM